MLFKLLYFSQLIYVFFTDLKFGKIPNKLVYSIFLISFSFFITSRFTDIPVRFIISVLFFLIFYIIQLLTKGLGTGDIKLLCAIAFSSGFFKTIFATIIACLLGLLIFLLFHILKIKIDKLPFAPFLVIGIVFFELTGGLIKC